MKLAAIKEDMDFRSAITPKFVKKFIDLGIEVFVEKDIGKKINISDKDYTDAKATVGKKKDILKNADIILKVTKPDKKDIDLFKENSIFISLLDPFFEEKIIDKFLSKNLSLISMNLIARTTIAQKMDALSSQANLAGYASIIFAAKHHNKIFPMMTTPSGTISPAKVFIIGAGVAGLQAIATAKRLGATIEAFDTREETKEQIKSLGAKPLKIDLGKTESTKSGYAKALTDEQLKIQREAIKKAIANSDIVITTAQVFGRKAPVIITKDILKDIKKPITILDMAISTGGNVEGSKADETTKVNNISILAPLRLTDEVALDASSMYSANLYNLIEHFFDKEKKSFKLDLEDEILKGAILCHNKQIVSEILKKGKN